MNFLELAKERYSVRKFSNKKVEKEKTRPVVDNFEAKLKENYVNIPGANGSLNLSYAPQGYPVYEDREISFTLFKGVDDIALEAIRAELANMFHGKEVELALPNDPNSFWTGVIQFGAISGYNSGKIPVTFRAQPYKVNISTGAKSL